MTEQQPPHQRVVAAIAGPHNRSDRALAAAIDLSSLTGSQLVLSHRMTDEDAGSSIERLSGLASELAQKHDLDIVAEVHDDDDLADLFRLGPIVACVASSKGTVYEGDRYVGSATEYLIGELDCPVLVIGPNDDQRGLDLDCVVAAVDPASSHTDVTMMAAGLAGLIGVPVAMARVFTAGESQPPPDANWRTARVEDRHEIADALIELAGPRGLLALSSHARSGMDRLTLGSVASDVIARSHTPVLVVHTTEPG